LKYVYCAADEEVDIDVETLKEAELAKVLEKVAVPANRKPRANA